MLFQFRIAFRTCAFVFFFGSAARCTRLRISSGPFCLQANTSPGAAPGITTRFLLSAVKVMVGLSHIAKASQRVGACVSPECLVVALQNFSVETARINSRFARGDLIMLTNDFSFVIPVARLG